MSAANRFPASASEFESPELEDYGSFRDLTLRGPGGGKAYGLNDLASVFNQQNMGCNSTSPSTTPAGCPQS